MANILKGRFGGPRGENPEKPPQPETAETQNPKATQEAYLRALAAEKKGDERAKGIAILGDVRLIAQVRKMHDRIMILRDINPSKEVRASSEKAWMSVPAKDLAAAVWNSSETEWKQKPSNFLALAAEHLNRLRRILDEFRE